MNTLLRRRIMMGLGGSPTPPTPILPYDAKIEYLQSSGTQFIYLNRSTNVNSVTNFTIKASIKWVGNIVNNQAQYLGANNGSFVGRANTNKINFNGVATTTNASTQNFVDLESTINYQTRAVSYKINGVSGSGTRASTVDNSRLCLFCLYRNGTMDYSYFCYCQLKYAQFFEDGNMIFDLIPVRVGTVGYMYDKLSGELFGNSGTGNFVLGNDITQ